MSHAPQPAAPPSEPKPRRKAGAGVVVPLLLLAYHHVGYPLLLELWDVLRGRRGDPLTELPPADELPKVSVIVAAYNEQRVIAAKIANLLELDYPRELLEIVVAGDGCDDATAQLARDAGADVVLGGHPHVLEGVEFYKGRPIMYSMGNFIFDQRPGIKMDSALFKLFYANGGWTVKVVPVWLPPGRYSPEYPGPEKRNAILQRIGLAERFDAIVTGASDKGTWVRLVRPPIEGRLKSGFEGLDVGRRLRVELVLADVELGYIDFKRVEQEAS